ncbi:hypothetical protein DFH06DRAFT_1151257 [Mycena polygramma]|nr:hypothetical protein DFH06DRAFT_1151257 [Mycena polygramma]
MKIGPKPVPDNPSGLFFASTHALTPSQEISAYPQYAYHKLGVAWVNQETGTRTPGYIAFAGWASVLTFERQEGTSFHGVVTMIDGRNFLGSYWLWNSSKRGGFTLHKHADDRWRVNKTARYRKNGGCGCARRRARRQFKRAAVEIGLRQCAAMEKIDAATTRGDAAMWYQVAAVLPCDAARRGAKAADAAN